ncbi:ABC transporter substrate-binding protein [Tessaracoccus palaemonis]|uniref:Extracellular solute-binding protein n=1 Tax=Tessaracoccus palaemonis TaxID=2829499 RepID=A0ABX8SHS9_9ACTN|nr:extracellular solute-binding protein [Tessaracoccus palaemonis]QXT62855.1 extracellular solute-binding protein [Tessaracoccus palaemonis]
MTTRYLRLGAVGIVAAVGLTACAGNTTTGSTPAESSAPAAEKVSLQYLHRLPDGEGMTKIADIVAKWNAEHPDIQVEATKFDGQAAEMVKKLENDVKADSAACLAQVGYAEVPSLYTKGLLEDVTAEAAKYTANFSEGAQGLMKVGDISVGLPQDTGPLVYYYNKAEFEKLGLDVPTTADELVATAAKAAEQGKYITAFQPDEAQYWLAAQSAAAGATWYTVENDAWKVNVTSEETAKVADTWQQMLDAKTTLVENRWGDGFKAALIDQSLIGTVGAAWEAPLLAGDMAGSDNEGQWAVTQLPMFATQQMTGPDGGSGVAVMKGCDHPAQAMEFNNWLNTQIDDLATQGLVVAAKGTVTTPESVSDFYGGQDVFAELAAANDTLNPAFGYMPTWPAIADPMAKAAAAAGDGSGKVADIFTAAQDASVSSLKDAGLPVA